MLRGLIEKFTRKYSDQEIKEILGSALHPKFREVKSYVYELFANKYFHSHKIIDKLKDIEERKSAFNDAYQEFLSNVSSGRFRGEESIRRYFFRIFNNRCMDMVRAKNRQKRPDKHFLPLLPEQMNGISDSTKDIIERMSLKFDINMINSLIDQMKERCREILFLFNQGYKDSEIADAMEDKTELVRKARYACLKKLRTMALGKIDYQNG